MFLSFNARICDGIHCKRSYNRLILSAFAILIMAGSVLAQDQKKPKKKSAKPHYTISKETTFVTGPLTKDGHLDFVGAINNRYSKGVTPQNNAAVLYLKAMGPSVKGTIVPKSYYAQLGLQVLPEQDNHFLNFYDYILKKDGLKLVEEEYEKLNEQRELAQRQLWKASDYPHVAKWLKYNEKSLKIIIEGTKRSHYFMPVMRHKEGDNIDYTLYDSLLPFPQISRDMARALACRAMLKINEKKFKEAWQDLLACHRLARHVGNGFSTIEALVSYDIERIAFRAELVFLEHSKPNAAEASKYLKDINALSPLSSIVEKYNFGERLSYLDSVVCTTQHIYSKKRGVSTDGRDEKSVVFDIVELTELMLKHYGTPNPNWNIILKEGNRKFDKIVSALRIEDRIKRTSTFDELSAEFLKIKESFPKKIKLTPKLNYNNAVSRHVGEMLIIYVLPAFIQTLKVEHRAQQYQRNLIVAFLLAAYKSDHGKYPANIAELLPKYLAKIPNDIFTDKPLKYKITKDGYLLYSLGANGKDDKGSSIYFGENTGDDITVRMPPRVN